MKNILSFYANLLLKLSLTQSILITTFTSWIRCLWGDFPCQHIPQAFLLLHSLQHVGRNCCHVFPDVLFQIHRCPLFFSYALLLRYPQRKKYCNWGHSFWWILKCRWNILWVTTESLFFLNTSLQLKPDALQTSAPWQLKYFESR